MPLSAMTDNLEMGAPYPLLSGTLNLLGERRSEDRCWPFLFSPLFCGSRVTGYADTRAYLGGFDDLAQVMALSGAAVSPTQAHSLAAAALLTLVNARTGQWLPLPDAGGQRAGRLRRWLLGRPAALCLLAELFRDAEDRLRGFVSDGGHSENLGLWPLLLRRCRLIIVSDAGEDPEHSFDDFLKVCRRMRLYHGVQVFDLHDDRPVDARPLLLQQDRTCAYHFFLGRVLYPEGFMGATRPEEGYLIYLKPSVTKDEDNDLLRHFRLRRPFPHDPTLNQLFDEDTVESYRQLGQHIGETLGRALPDDLWEKGKHYPIEELFWRYLIRGPRDDLTPGQRRRDAERALRRYDAGPAHRKALAEEVRRLLAAATRRRPAPAAGDGDGAADGAADGRGGGP
jgi:hypothetical protein